MEKGQKMQQGGMLGMQIQKGWAHDATLLPCNYCYALGRLDS